MLSERLGQGWRVQWTKLTKNHGWTDFADRLGKRGEDWFLLGGISPSGAFRLYSKEQPFKLDTGWTALIFAPAQAQAKEPEPEAVS